MLHCTLTFSVSADGALAVSNISLLDVGSNDDGTVTVMVQSFISQRSVLKLFCIFIRLFLSISRNCAEDTNKTISAHF